MLILTFQDILGIIVCSSAIILMGAALVVGSISDYIRERRNDGN